MTETVQKHVGGVAAISTKVLCYIHSTDPYIELNVYFERE